MTGRIDRLRIALTAAVAMLAVTCVYADSYKLELRRLSTNSTSPTENPLLSTSAQSFLVLPGRGLYRHPGSKLPNFSEVIRKEPPKYQTDKPFRAVAKLGSQHFGFVLDTAAKEKEERTSDTKQEFELVRYNRLLFDLNHNGDLTDDEVIAGKEVQGISRRASYARYSFPRVDLTIEADGVETEYAFNFSVSSTNDKGGYVSASLSAAAYRYGEVTLDGKKKRIMLVDYNSNGRFDDGWSIDPLKRYAGDKVYSTTGDMISVASDTRVTSGISPTTNESQQFLSKVVKIEGRYFDVSATPTGDTLTLNPSSIPVGHVTNPNKAYRAVVYSDLGFVTIGGDGSGKAALPEGEWKLMSYTAVLTQNQGSSRPRSSRISASGTHSYVAVKVRGGETVKFPFGPPFTPKVTVSHQPGSSTAFLQMSLIGAGDELCSSIYVNGGRPPGPEFTITDPAGKVVKTGNFEYG